MGKYLSNAMDAMFQTMSDNMERGLKAEELLETTLAAEDRASERWYEQANYTHGLELEKLQATRLKKLRNQDAFLKSMGINETNRQLVLQGGDSGFNEWTKVIIDANKNNVDGNALFGLGQSSASLVQDLNAVTGETNLEATGQKTGTEIANGPREAWKALKTKKDSKKTLHTIRADHFSEMQRMTEMGIGTDDPEYIKIKNKFDNIDSQIKSEKLVMTNADVNSIFRSVMVSNENNMAFQRDKNDKFTESLVGRSIPYNLARLGAAYEIQTSYKKDKYANPALFERGKILFEDARSILGRHLDEAFEIYKNNQFDAEKIQTGNIKLEGTSYKGTETGVIDFMKIKTAKIIPSETINAAYNNDKTGGMQSFDWLSSYLQNTAQRYLVNTIYLMQPVPEINFKGGSFIYTGKTSEQYTEDPKEGLFITQLGFHPTGVDITGGIQPESRADIIN